MVVAGSLLRATAGAISASRVQQPAGLRTAPVGAVSLTRSRKPTSMAAAKGISFASSTSVRGGVTLPVRLRKPDSRCTRGRGQLDCSAFGPPPQADDGTADVKIVDPALKTDQTEGWRKRWTMVGLCFMAFMLCNMDRVNMSIAIMPMAKEFAWNSATVGLIQSSFFWGYLLTQILGGVWADRYGGKVVLGFGVVWWSLATMLTPVAVRAGLPVLLTMRMCMGIGEGVAMPAMNSIIAKWVPGSERSRSLAVLYSGQFLGSVAGLSLSPAMVSSLGWPSVFYGFGVLGLVWIVFWLKIAANNPAEDPSLAETEKSFISRPKP